MACCCLVIKSRSTLLWSLDCSPSSSSVRGISQAKILEWVAISFSEDIPDPGIKPTSPALAAQLENTLQHSWSQAWSRDYFSATDGNRGMKAISKALIHRVHVCHTLFLWNLEVRLCWTMQTAQWPQGWGSKMKGNCAPNNLMEQHRPTYLRWAVRRLLSVREINFCIL